MMACTRLVCLVTLIVAFIAHNVAHAFVEHPTQHSSTSSSIGSSSSRKGLSLLLLPPKVMNGAGRRENRSCRSFVSSHLFVSPKDTAAPLTPWRAPKELTYGEESRRYRRTVYTHEDWIKHRSPDRYFRNLSTIIASGVYKNLGREVLATIGVATAVVVWNLLVGGWTDWRGVVHGGLFQKLPLIQLPLTGFTLLSPSLGLLLVFRTNTAYQRWDEARKNWGKNINHTRDLMRMASAFYKGKNHQQDMNRLALTTWSFVRSMKRHLSPEWEDEEDYQQEIRQRLPAEQAEALLAANHRPNRALHDLSRCIESLPMHFMRKNQLHTSLTIFEDNLGSSERLLTSPVPLFYSRHTARFLSAWLLLLPLGLWNAFASTWNHFAMIPATAMLSVFLLGIEELATQMEEPFTILPMQVFCDKIYNWCMEIASWEPSSSSSSSTADEKEDEESWMKENDIGSSMSWNSSNNWGVSGFAG